MDEVGRGCWAGPVVVGAVILASPIVGLRDSKQLTAKRRENMAAIIRAEAHAVALGEASPAEIGEFGLTEALSLAYHRALSGIHTSFDQVIIDGNFNFLSDVPHVQTVIKADASEPAVSAASIVAKVARDHLMSEMDRVYPGYGFAKHVGYGTAAHSAALAQLGICDLHRLSFAPIKRILGQTT
jgi:ribonuclease HII